MTTPETAPHAPQPAPDAVASGAGVVAPGAGVVAPGAEVVPGGPAPRQRSKLPWIVGGVVAGVLLVVAAAVAVVFVVLPSLDSGRTPADAVLDYDRAYHEVDCALYESVTTEGFRSGFVETCEDFEFEAREFVDAFSDYEVSVTSSTIADGGATVETTESWMLNGDPGSAEYVYTLVRHDGGWKIDTLE